MGRCVAKRTLSRYLDGELPPSAAEAVRAHLAGCASCRQALNGLRSVDDVVARAAVADEAPPGGDADRAEAAPDIASAVVGELKRRGAFFAASVTGAKRRIVGRRFVPGRLAAAFSAAAGIVLLSLAGLDYASRREWARRTGPVLADAEHVLVRLVLVEPGEESPALAQARADAGEVAERLAGVRRDARAGVAPELAYLEQAFTRLARADDMPPDLVAKLADGEVRDRLARLRAELAGGP